MENHGIRNLVFDFSDTLARFNGPSYMLELCGGDKETADRIYNNVFSHSVWARYDLGEIGTEETHRLMTAEYSGEESEILARYLSAWTDQYKPMPGMEPLLKKLKAEGFRLYLLSDFPEVFPPLLDRFPFLKEFDGRMVSYEVGLSKRYGSEIFRHLCSTFDLRPEECFYADDLEKNIASARSVGMKGYVFKSAQGYEKALREALK